MMKRIPLLIESALRPEWIDYALEQYMNNDPIEARKIIKEYIDANVKGIVTRDKTIRQLDRAVGSQSILKQDYLKSVYNKIINLSPDARTPLRLEILVKSNPFTADCVNTIKKFTRLQEDGISLSQMYERIHEIYGDRQTVDRRVRYVLQTLKDMNIVENRDKKWIVNNEYIETIAKLINI